MPFLRSLLFAIVFYTVTVGVLLVSLPILLVRPHAMEAIALWWTRFYRGLAARLVHVRVVVEGHVPPAPVIVACKHESMFETLILVTVLDHPVPVLKRELAEIPLFGRSITRWGAIPVDREGSAKALRAMLVAAKSAIAGGRPILIFPEGTRVLPGERPPLRSGFAGLYRAANLPVVPVAVNSGRLWPKGLMKRAGTVTLRFGDPIPPGLSRPAVEAAVHAAINELNGASPT